MSPRPGETTIRGWSTRCLPLTHSRRPLISTARSPRSARPRSPRSSDDGECRMTEVGDVLYREGDLDYDFVVILEGKVAIVEGYERPEEHVIGSPRPAPVPRRDQPADRTGGLRHGGGRRARRGAGRAGGAAPRARARGHRAGDLILRAYLQRRSILIEVGAGFRILGSCYSPDTRRLAGVRRPQPAATPLRRPRSGRRRPSRCCASSASAPEETPVVIWRKRLRPAQPEQRRAGPADRSARAGAERRSCTTC